MTNYYVELGLDRAASIEELEKELRALKKTWVSRANNISSLEKRQNAERMVALIREASEVLLDKDAKKKYDKELDKDPAAFSSSQSGPQQQENVNLDTNSFDSAALLDLIEQAYDKGNYNMAFAVGKKAIETNNASLEILRILALCYSERGDEANCFTVLQYMLELYGDNDQAHFAYATLCLRALTGHTQDAKKSIDWLVENGYGENSSVKSLDIIYDIHRGDIDIANKKIDDYLAENGNDKAFREQVGRELESYADGTSFSEYGGDIYFDSADKFKNWLTLTERSLQIYPNSQTKEYYEAIKEWAKPTFYTDNVLGIACGALLSWVFLSDFGPAYSTFYAILGVVIAILTVGMIVFSVVPEWQNRRLKYTGSFDGIPEVFRVISYVTSIVLRGIWWVIKLIFQIIGILFSFFG